MFKKLTATGLLAIILSLTIVMAPAFADGNNSEVAADGTTVIDPANEGNSTGTITRPDENGSKICDETMPECLETTPTTPEEKPVIVPEGEYLESNDNSAIDLAASSDSLLDQLNFEQNWPMYFSFGSIILAIIFFIALNIIDRKRRAA